MRRVLMIAFHFPPCATGSGHLRTLGFARYLPHLGWEPTILSANTLAYPRIDNDNLKLIPAQCRVETAFALDVRRHLSIRGKYAGFLAQPDGWASWWPAAVIKGLRLIRRHRIDAIWSTYPIMTGHCIAHTLSRMTGLPWIADFRDPVASSVGTENRFSASSQKRCERRVLAQASGAVFTTIGAMNSYALNYPQAAQDRRLTVIPNGYDEATFADLPALRTGRRGGRLRFVHSGTLYPDGRCPIPFFLALANLKAAGSLADEDIHILLRASGSEEVYEKEVRQLGLDLMVTLGPPISNHEALLEQADADALLLFQGIRFNHQIPAKAYEYLRIGRPIFALVDPDGDTAALLRETGGAQLVPMDEVSAIEKGLVEFFDALRTARAPKVMNSVVHRYSRYEGTVALAKLLDRVAPAE